MDAIEKNYRYFLTALEFWAENEGWGAKTTLAAAVQKSLAFIGQILSHKNRASFATQVQLAEACGYSYLDFLNLGRRQVEGDQIEVETKKKPSICSDPVLMEKLSLLDAKDRSSLLAWLEGYLEGVKKDKT